MNEHIAIKNIQTDTTRNFYWQLLPTLDYHMPSHKTKKKTLEKFPILVYLQISNFIDIQDTWHTRSGYCKKY